MSQQEQEQPKVTKTIQKILDSAYEEAVSNVETFKTLEQGLQDQHKKNVENFEGIKSGIVKKHARLLRDVEDKASKSLITSKSTIARLLVKTLVSNGENKKTQISQTHIYRVLKADEFKVLKHENNSNSAKGRGKNQTGTRSHGETSTTPAPTCAQILTEEAKKIREQNPGLSNQEIRKIVKNLDTVKKWSDNTVRKELKVVLPVQKSHKEPTPEVATPRGGLSQEVIDEENLEANLTEKIGLFAQVIEWLSGMKEGERTEFYKHLPKGKPYTLALEDKCKGHIMYLIKRMPDPFVSSFLQYTNEITHLIKMWDEALYEEKLLRENKRNMASR